MKLSAPVHQLRSQAKQLKKQRQIPLFQAQNQIAQEQGFSSWSLMMARQEELLPENSTELLDYLNAGDLVLLGARPRLGKTLFTANLIADCIKMGRPRSFYFTLVDREQEARQRIINHFEDVGLDSGAPLVDSLLIDDLLIDGLLIDSSDDICASHVMHVLEKHNAQGALVVIDYLQVLDEKRAQPPLHEQVAVLNAFAKSSGCRIILIGQLDRRVDDRAGESPTLADIRLPNPLDMQLFNKVMFLYRQTMDGSRTTVSLVRPVIHEFVMELDLAAKRFRESA
tara:strand:- start:25102 stop:25950 length:849 start_codon:yes stop_codon:yes gene_type:complete